MKDHVIQMSHGGGGRQAREWIEAELLARFGTADAGMPDAAGLAVAGKRIGFTTDSFVVRPLEFPGGTIGSLAVHGTVNDLAVSGFRPRWLSLGLVLEEGVSCELIGRILDDLAAAARTCGVRVVTGDTKVVGRGEADKLFINTAGIGEPYPGFDLSSDHIRAGDAVLVSGPLGDHGATIMAAREHVAAGEALKSDSGPVHRLVEALRDEVGLVRMMRDPTRGGLSAVLHEFVEQRPLRIRLDEEAVPVRPAVRTLGELLGIDPLHMACEGRVVLVCAPEAADAVLASWRALPEGAEAARIGVVADAGPGQEGAVSLLTLTGGERLLDWPSGELLPRIC